MMAEAAEDTPRQDMHWGIAYLRTDIQDVRAEIRALHDRMDARTNTLEARFDELSRRLDTRFYMMMAMMAAWGTGMIAAMKL